MSHLRFARSGSSSPCGPPSLAVASSAQTRLIRQNEHRTRSRTGSNGETSMPRQHDRSPAPPDSGACCPRFNLFRHKMLAELFCAIPETYPVPAFVNGSTWTFAGTVNEASYDLAERNWHGAKEGVHLMGFYLFQSCPGHRQFAVLRTTYLFILGVPSRLLEIKLAQRSLI